MVSKNLTTFMIMINSNDKHKDFTYKGSFCLSFFPNYNKIYLPIQKVTFLYIYFNIIIKFSIREMTSSFPWGFLSLLYLHDLILDHYFPPIEILL